MKRILIVYNPRSSRFADVQKEVLSQANTLKGYIIGKYEVENTDVDQNAAKLAKIIKDDDLIISAGGDATASIASNSILLSGKNATLAALPYGNFNDLSRTLRTSNFHDIFNHKYHTGKLYPLEILVDNKFFRYATCYVTIGMTAEAVEIYDNPKVRKNLKKSSGRSFGSYLSLASWYFKNRHQKTFIPEFKLNNHLQHRQTSDYAAVNGRSMARIMKGGEDYRKPKVFRSQTDRLASFWRLFKLMLKSIFFRIPGSETTDDILEFTQPATVELQAEGEYRIFKNIKKIEIRKSDQCLKVIEN
ncbi:acylglycerol kinase family protein [Candidatus Saccharibacteria bacterium]|nr:acylglycerol kinase family protein [Candidatus Saccharibacteria bacterium]